MLPHCSFHDGPGLRGRGFVPDGSTACRVTAAPSERRRPTADCRRRDGRCDRRPGDITTPSNSTIVALRPLIGGVIPVGRATGKAELSASGGKHLTVKGLPKVAAQNFDEARLADPQNAGCLPSASYRTAARAATARPSCRTGLRRRGDLAATQRRESSLLKNERATERHQLAAAGAGIN